LLICLIPNHRLEKAPLVKGTADYDFNPNSFSTRTTKGMTRSRREIIVDLASQYAAARDEEYDQKQLSARNNSERVPAIPAGA
jgi:hypothetical protein